MTNERISRPAPGASGGRERTRRFISLFGSLSRPLAGRRWFRLWGVLHHVGRKSGRAYATPLVTRRVADGFIIPLPFGEGTQWVRNLQAACGGTIRWDGRDLPVVEPRVVQLAEISDAFSRAERAILGRARSKFVRVFDAKPEPGRVAQPADGNR